MSATNQANPDFELAVQFVAQTGKHLFLTGKAGTGKTTFLRYLQEHCPKKMAVVAPTGVAAINAGGVTMHSLFQLPFGPFIADFRTGWGAPNMEISNRHSLLKNLRLNNNKRNLLKELELLIIDEVSMLRADMLDAIDTVLRHVRQQAGPFGGVQVVYIGDLFQLPPVVNREEWQLLHTYYKSPFFFDAHVFGEAEPVCIELQKVYRQRDSTFISVLNSIRNNRADSEDIRILHERYKPDFEAPPGEKYIILTSHNAKADIVNKTELEKLDNKLQVFEGLTKGDFGDKLVPVEKHLLLKEGAQIMFVKNDKGESRRYYNGKIGTVARIEGDKIFIRFEQEPELLELAKETWRNINYKYNPDKDEIEEDEIGSFTQFPVRLAWAITIHKSQGLTFEKAIVDAGASFAAGQVYVALSRLTSLDGLVLHSKINPSQVMTDERVLTFTEGSLQRNKQLDTVLRAEQRQYAEKCLLQSFEGDKLVHALQEHNANLLKSSVADKDQAAAVLRDLWERATQLQQVAARFTQQLDALLAEAAMAGYAKLYERTRAATDYFSGIIGDMDKILSSHLAQWQVKPRAKKYVKELGTTHYLLLLQQQAVQQALKLAEGLSKGAPIGSLLDSIAADRKEKPVVAEPEVSAKKEKGASNRISLELYREGKSISEIAGIRSMALSTVESHLTAYVATGEVSIEAFVNREELNAILKTIRENTDAGSARLKELLGADVSYAQIKAVQAYQQRISSEG
jgi:hypothetical protein